MNLIDRMLSARRRRRDLDLLRDLDDHLLRDIGVDPGVLGRTVGATHIGRLQGRRH